MIQPTRGAAAIVGVAESDLGEVAPEMTPIDRMAQAVQAQASAVFGSYAAAIADDRLAESFGELADRLEEAALTDRRQG